jgi:hypothetical protein
MSTMADAKMPGIGKVNKPTLIIAGLAAVGAAFYAYEKKKKDAAAATTAAAAAYGYGYAYGGYGYGGIVGGAGGAGNYGGYGYGGYGYGAGSGGGVVVPPPPPQQVPVNNTQWVQFAQTFLASQGYNANLVGTTLNAYIHGQNVGANENIVQAAIAFEGNPPTAGANGYPPSINTSGSNGGQNPGGGVTGGKAQYADNPPKNLHLISGGKTGVKIGWDPVKGASHYIVYTPERSTKQFLTAATTANIGSLKAGTSYEVQVWADPTPAGGPHASMTIPAAR